MQRSSTGLGRAVFTSNDLGTHIERIDPHGHLDRRWATLWSANRLALDPTGRYLYAAQSFTRAAIRRIEVANPTNITVYLRRRYRVPPPCSTR